MKIKLNQFERVAGLFVGLAMVGGVVAAVGIAVKQGWFATKVKYETTFLNAEGVYPGTLVQISGLRAGSVNDVELLTDNKIRVSFEVLSKFQHRIKKDSAAQLIRPFIIGERVLDISVGSEDSQTLASGGHLESREAMDMMSLLSGKKIGNYLTGISEMTENLKELAEAFLDKTRTQNLVKMFDRVEPLIRNLNTMSVEVIKMSKQANEGDRLGTVLDNIKVTTGELNALIPVLKEKSPNMASDVASIVENLAILTKEFKVVLPALAEIAPDLPHASRRSVEALDEAVVLLKAMQKSFLLRGNVEDVHEEEMAREQQKNKKQRVPASEQLPEDKK